MPKKNKFSIVVAVYNRPEEMYELLDSIVNQEFKDLEIIVVDDGSCCSYYPLQTNGNGYEMNIHWKKRCEMA